MENKSRLAFIIFAFLTIIVIGIIGYMYILKVNFIDALYMTAITISTVGYGEVSDMNNAAKIFSIIIIFSGLGVAGYGFTSIVALFFEGELKDAWRRKKMKDTINTLKDHYIVCGAGEIGHTVIKQFQNNSMHFIVIEKNPNRISELRQVGILCIHGDATSEDILTKARIEYAKGVVCTLSNDADNVFTVLTVRQINSDVYIVSKAINKNAHNKLIKAGANKTISPNEIGGNRMAALFIRPSVISFLDVITQAGEITLDLEEVTIEPNSHLIGKTLRAAKIPEQTGLIVLAIKKSGDTKLKFNPSSNEILAEGDTMIVLGQDEQVDTLKIFTYKK